MKASDVITRVREIVSDEITPFRYENAELLRYISDGQVQLFRRHPEATYSTTVNVTAPSAVESPTSDLVITDDFSDAIIYYCAWRTLSKDAEDSVNLSLAENFRNKYIAELE